MLKNQALLFFIFIINGVVIGFFFDFFRILRKSFKTSDHLTYLEDFIFWILTGFSILFTLFKFNNGEIRLYIFLAIAIGIFIYVIFFSHFIIKISIFIIVMLKKIFKAICIPVKYIKIFLRNTIYKPFSFIIINIRVLYTNFYKILIKNINKIKIKKDF